MPCDVVCDHELQRRDAAAAWASVALLTLAYALSYVDRTIILLLVGPIRADLQISDTQFSLLHGLAFAILYTVVGIPIGVLADRHNRPRIIAVGIALWSLMTALCGTARNFAHLFAARVGVGIGEAALSPAAYSLITDLAPKHQVGRALGAYGAGVYLGIGATFLVGGWLVDALVARGGFDWWMLAGLAPWQQVFVLVGVAGLPVALATLLMLPEPRKGAKQRGLSRSAALGPYLRRNWRFIAALFLGFSFISLLFNGFLAWLAEYYLRAHGWSKSRTGVWIGLIMLSAGPLGMAAGGWLTDVWRRRRPVTAPVHVGLWGAVALLPWPLWATVVDSPGLSLAGITPIIFFSCFCFGPAVTAIQLTTPPELRARLSAVYLFVVNLTGIGLGGTAIAFVSDHVLRDETRIGGAMAIVGTTAVVFGVASIWLAKAAAERLYERAPPE